MGMMINRRRVCGGKSLPYDAEIEYLESSGTQYIDTGVVPTIGSAYDVIFQITNTNIGSICLTGWLNGKRYNFGCMDLYGTLYIAAGFDQNVALCEPDAKRHHIYANESNKRIVFDEVIYSCNARSSIEGGLVTKGMTLFARSRKGSVDYKGCMRIFNFSYYNELGVLILDYIPVRIGTTGYMYDKVSGQLFGNSGTGDFILGPDV